MYLILVRLHFQSMWTHSGTEKGQSVVLSKAMGTVPAVSVIRINTKVWLGLVFGFEFI